MKINKENLPVTMEAPGTLMRTQAGFGGMTVAYTKLPAGTDFTPLLEGLKNDSCHCPHWGYIFEGSMKLKYDDGTEEIASAGEVFYWKPGHTAIVEKDVILMDFSPDKEMGEVMGHIMKKMEAMSG
ncbi:MAG: cupin domain-containing protein [Cyclobacteriaceae bacterium]|nr:cupin domain-containing protein [Cyclobacteriaceae bacterium]